ncbi:MAG: methyltransferase domain-containing protein [Candidatus Dadabacteria bacterium]|nr:MAG: methyltransferase domain-containing protein [Candidatus Dadabacteria bacterium]
MKTKWDYSELAKAYLNRPDYSEDAINELIKLSRISSDAKVCDIGAGTAHLTLMFLKRGYTVTAVEPNDEMRRFGIERTKEYSKRVKWVEATAEETGLPDESFNLVTFGSSFNVTDRQRALQESYRLLKPQGWFACMWNHRNLDDPLQAEIERLIKSFIPNYSYGTRREDQTKIINQSNLFNTVFKIEKPVTHTITKEQCIEAWKSHATLQRQAGDQFLQVVSAIAELINKTVSGNTVTIPYTTRVWAAEVRK